MFSGRYRGNSLRGNVTRENGPIEYGLRGNENTGSGTIPPFARKAKFENSRIIKKYLKFIFQYGDK
jgi:hypothetical protein